MTLSPTEQARIRNLLVSGTRPRIAVAGDLMLDHYVFGKVERISPEAPIQVLEVEREEERLGGAANVARNLTAIGAEVQVLGAVGKDEPGSRLRALLAEAGADASKLLELADRPTSLKTRMVAHAQQVLRVDRECKLPLDAAAEARVVSVLENLGPVDALLLSDYGKGYLTPSVIQAACKAGRRSKVPVLVDPKGSDYRIYEGATILTPNRKEAEAASGHPIRDDRLASDLPKVADAILKLTKAEALLITLGAGGVYLRTSRGEERRVPARARSVYDVTGAGDTAIAWLAWGLAAGGSLETALEAANLAAGVAVGRLGAVTVNRDEALAELAGPAELGSHKIVSAEVAAGTARTWRDAGRKVCFTNGCFDLLHAGHVSLLRWARSQGEALVVGVNSDDSIRRLKGPHRPIVEEQARTSVLAALESVDLVVVFGEDTPLELIRALRPDVLVKGEDYRGREVVGQELVESWGGRVALAPLLEGFSTTRIVENIRAAGGI